MDNTVNDNNGNNDNLLDFVPLDEAKFKIKSEQTLEVEMIIEDIECYRELLWSNEENFVDDLIYEIKVNPSRGYSEKQIKWLRGIRERVCE